MFYSWENLALRLSNSSQGRVTKERNHSLLTGWPQFTFHWEDSSCSFPVARRLSTFFQVVQIRRLSDHPPPTVFFVTCWWVATTSHFRPVLGLPHPMEGKWSKAQEDNEQEADWPPAGSFKPMLPTTPFPTPISMLNIFKPHLKLINLNLALQVKWCFKPMA